MRGLLLVAVLAVGLVAGGGWLEYRDFLVRPMVPEQGPQMLLDVAPGTSLLDLSEKLTELGLVAHPYLFLAVAYLDGKAASLKAGEYALSPGATPPELLDLVTSGKIVQHAFTVVEGWTYRQLLAAIARDGRIGNRFGKEPPAEVIMTYLGHPKQHPEGRFLPETYYFTKGAGNLDILRWAYGAMEQALQEEWERRDAKLPLKDPYEALILASIVEKEAGLAAERPIIGGVFIRRLHLGMKLQADPTVIYGLGERFKGNITRAHLREDTAYNTYVHKGLPPTPIALPGRDTIRGVLQPQEGNALFFVAKGDGGHYFSATLAEHNQAVRRYLSKRRR